MEPTSFIEIGKAEGWIHETGNSGRVTIGGALENKPVYEVRTDKLHFNPQNGRIATFMSKYENEHGSLPTDPAELDRVIERMIEQDNPNRLKKTRMDIRAKGQQEVAVILSDGTVIDGNRRFTCLRQLARDEASERFLRCYIFPDSYDSKAIKGLELDIQLGKDDKVNYDPIARLVDIDRWVNGKMMSKEEYAEHAGISKAEMNKSLTQIAVMNDFLDMIGAPGSYYIVQDMKLQAPIETLAARLPKCKSEDERDDMKSIVYANCLTQNLGDSARSSRDLCKYITDSQQSGDGFVEEQLDIAERVFDMLQESGDAPVTTTFIRDVIGADSDLKARQAASRERQRARFNNIQVKTGQVRGTRDALDSLAGVDVRLFSKLSQDQLQEMYDNLERLAEETEKLRALVVDAIHGA